MNIDPKTIVTRSMALELVTQILLHMDGSFKKAGAVAATTSACKAVEEFIFPDKDKKGSSDK